MGYRHKIGILKKAKHNKIKDMTFAELSKWHGKEYVPSYEIAEEVFELGKYCDDGFLKPYRSPVFTLKEVDDLFQEDADFYLLSKEGFEAIIEDYRSRIVSYFKNLYSQFGANSVKFMTKHLDRETPEQYIKSKLCTWDNQIGLPYNLSLESDEVVCSWYYEYTIFELVRLYKKVNWETEHVTITAW